MERRLKQVLPGGKFKHTDAQRSKIMAAIRSADSKPEMAVRRLVHGLGYRFRLHRRDLPGHPDLVFPARRKAIFVHGCFWHAHDCPLGRRNPKTHSDYWRDKLKGNVRRDHRNLRRLRRDGWGVMVVWECRVKPRNLDRLAHRIVRFLEE